MLGWQMECDEREWLSASEMSAMTRPTAAVVG